MSLINKQNKHYKTISQTCFIANIVYLVLRVIYFILFTVTKVYVMMWVDLASIFIYLFCFYLMKKKKYYLYALVCGNEFLVFIITATLMVGFNSGFHFYLIGLCVVSYFTSYFSKTKNVKNAIIWAGLSVIIYLTIYIISCFVAPHYVIPKWLEMTLMIIHIFMAFVFVTAYLVVFLRYALSLERKILNESRTDELTQINNRYGLYDYFNSEKNRNNEVLALFDIDDFKNVNDVYGHVAGDYILKRVAEITFNIFAEDFVCRYGGEEFVIVLDKEKSFEKLEELRLAIQNEEFVFEGNSLRVTITIGIADYIKDITLEKWVRAADEKMYSGKKSGKNKTVI